MDKRVVDGFGDEWSRFDQSQLKDGELEQAFNDYFAIFPWSKLPAGAEGFDMGCGSGRWAQLVAPQVGKLHCIDPSPKALNVARQNLSAYENCHFHLASVDVVALADGSQDFGYCLGVLHHIPETEAGLRAAVNKLKKGAPFLLYLYYAFDHRPWWFKMIWRTSNLARVVISRMPHSMRYGVSQLIAAGVYWPLARSAFVAERLGMNVSHFPLNYYRDRGFYSMRTDALDRFGTRLEKRFTKKQIEQMMTAAGLTSISFSPNAPYWCAIGYKA